MAEMCYAGSFMNGFQAAMQYFYGACNHSWRGLGANAYNAQYERTQRRMWLLGEMLNELEGARYQLEALV